MVRSALTNKLNGTEVVSGSNYRSNQATTTKQKKNKTGKTKTKNDKKKRKRKKEQQQQQQPKKKSSVPLDTFCDDVLISSGEGGSGDSITRKSSINNDPFFLLLHFTSSSSNNSIYTSSSSIITVNKAFSFITFIINNTTSTIMSRVLVVGNVTVSVHFTVSHIVRNSKLYQVPGMYQYLTVTVRYFEVIP